MPEAAVHRGGELLTRTRRRSDDGQLSTTGFETQSWHGPASNPVNGGGGSSWFSWFSRQEQQHQQQHQQSMGATSAPASAPRGPPGSLSPGGGLLGGLLRTEQEELEVEVIRKLVDSYFSIVRKTLLDQVGA